MIKVVNLIFGISSQVLILTLFLELFKFFEKHPFFQFSLSLFFSMKETLFSGFKDTVAYTLQSEVAPPGPDTVDTINMQVVSIIPMVKAVEASTYFSEQTGQLSDRQKYIFLLYFHLFPVSYFTPKLLE